jgi:hypothetical protein
VKGRDRCNEGVKEVLNIYFTEDFKENFSLLYLIIERSDGCFLSFLIQIQDITG